MDRRSFITLGGTGIVTAGLSLVGCHSGNSNLAKAQMAGGIYFTKNSPGRWENKVNGHVPNINVDKKTNTIVVDTNHDMTSYKHYIVKHVILDKNFEYIDEYVFKRR